MAHPEKKKASTEPEIMEKLVALCKQRGFVFQSSEIYGGLKSCYDYGPLGTELKRNVKAEWWRAMVHSREDIVGLDASIIMHPDVWRASGHLAGFADPMATCARCGKSFRADHVWELLLDSGWYQALLELYQNNEVSSLVLKRWAEQKGKKLAPNLALCRDPDGTLARLAEKTGGEIPGSLTFKEFVQHLTTEQLERTGLQNPCLECGGELQEPRAFNLMFRTSLGPVDPIEAFIARMRQKQSQLVGACSTPNNTEWLDLLRQECKAAVEESAVYLRPETAQAMFTNFSNVQQSMRMKLPFGIAQQGKSFRNEITVKHFTFRSCEFEQMEMEFFCHPPEFTPPGAKTDMQWFEYWSNERLNWYARLGLRKEKLRLRAHEANEMAHYAKACNDIEYEYPWGWGELEGIAHRTDYDLKQHEKHSGKKLTYFDPLVNKHYHPLVIEPAAGADRAALAFLIDGFAEEPPPPGTNEGRTVLRLHPRLAPVKLAVFPLVKKEGMPEAARKIVDEFSQCGIKASYDEKDAIGRRYRRQDECGTPYCITVDGQTAQDGSVTIRERDSMKQERIQVAEAVKVVQKRLAE